MRSRTFEACEVSYARRGRTAAIAINCRRAIHRFDKLPLRVRERALYVMLLVLLLALIVAPTTTVLGSSGIGLFTWVKSLFGR